MKIGKVNYSSLGYPKKRISDIWEATPGNWLHRFGTLNHLINRANFTLDRSMGFGLGTSEKHMFPFENELVHNTV